MRLLSRNQTAFRTSGRTTTRPIPCAAPPTRCQSTLSVDPSTSKASVTAVEQLKAWASSSKSVSVDKVTVSSDIEDSSGILTATKDIASGESILTIPDAAWLSPSAISQRAPTYGKLVSELEPWLQLTIALMCEKSGNTGGKKSEWDAYLAVLPQQPCSPLFWTEEQLALLDGTQLQEALLGYTSFFSQTYTELHDTLFSKHPATFPPQHFTAPAFTWAAATVRARLHAPLDTAPMALVPLADSLGFSRVGNSKWSLRSGGLFNRGQSLVVEATRPIRQGEQLTMDFAEGKLDNTVLLDYGLLDRAAPQPGYLLSLSLQEDEKYPDDKLDVLAQAGMASEMSFNLSPTEQPSSEMMAFMRMVHLQGMDSFLLEPIFRAEAWYHMMEPISEANEKAVCQAISSGARAVLAAYPGSIVADRDLLNSGTLKRGSREEQAVLVRLGEKESLDSALRFFEEREELLKELEYYQERRLKGLGLLDGRGNSTYDGLFEGGIA